MKKNAASDTLQKILLFSKAVVSFESRIHWPIEVFIDTDYFQHFSRDVLEYFSPSEPEPSSWMLTT